ncbi:hypothetical protein K438DRAFT_2086376 [Mycena galopus ATCC 62051]|nr:hypothetical protein K438DRAFT_2086376 [Mycena galopus ATCC 62051]
MSAAEGTRRDEVNKIEHFRFSCYELMTMVARKNLGVGNCTCAKSGGGGSEAVWWGFVEVRGITNPEMAENVERLGKPMFAFFVPNMCLEQALNTKHQNERKMDWIKLWRLVTVPKQNKAGFGNASSTFKSWDTTDVKSKATLWHELGGNAAGTCQIALKTAAEPYKEPLEAQQGVLTANILGYKRLEANIEGNLQDLGTDRALVLAAMTLFASSCHSCDSYICVHAHSNENSTASFGRFCAVAIFPYPRALKRYCGDKDQCEEREIVDKEYCTQWEPTGSLHWIPTTLGGKSQNLKPICLGPMWFTTIRGPVTTCNSLVTEELGALLKELFGY